MTPPARKLIRALEPRLMFDAAALVTLADQADHASDTAAGSASGAAPDGLSYAPDAVGGGPAVADAGPHLVFVDPRVIQGDALLSDLPPGAEIVVLDPNRDGLAQMAEHLAGRGGIAAIHVLAHGGEGSAILGDLHLDAGNVDAHAANLRAIGAALSESGDLLFYGCGIGAGPGRATLVARLADLTGADVAASSDDTGAASLGGDWVLETVSGTVEARLAVGPVAQGLMTASWPSATRCRAPIPSRR